MTLDISKFPIGPFVSPDEITSLDLQRYISEISSFPQRIRKEVENLSDEQLDSSYREGGWTIRQVVNHCADSHMNSLIRFKLALTEDTPTIKPYFEDRWAELIDSKTIPIEPALKTLEGVHARWTILLKSLTNEQLKRTFIHPEHGKEVQIDENIALYAWHCNHHLAHITMLKSRMKW
jgi:uncharacterized damage-inducible protein DinB